METFPPMQRNHLMKSKFNQDICCLVIISLTLAESWNHAYNRWCNSEMIWNHALEIIDGVTKKWFKIALYDIV